MVPEHFSQGSLIVFPSLNRSGWQAAACLGGGILLILFIVALLILTIAAPPSASSSPGTLPGLSGGMGVGAIALILRGIYLLRGPARAIVSDTGLLLEGYISRKWVSWGEIRSIRQDKKSQLFGDSLEILTLLDAGGKVIARVPDSLGFFKELKQEIAARSAAAQGRVTLDTALEEKREAQRETKSRRRTLVLGSILLVLFGTVFGFGVYEEVHTRQFASQAVRTEARITNRYMVRVTPRLEYRFTDLRGQEFTRETMMELADWNALAGRKTVAVEYLPNDPSWNRLLRGEREAATLGGKFLILSGGGTLFWLALLIFVALGYDVKTDGGMRLTRYGKPVGGGGATPAPRPDFVPGPPVPVQSNDSIASSLSAPWPPAEPEYAPTAAWPTHSIGPPQIAPRKPTGLIALGVIAIVLGLGGTCLNGGRAALATMNSLDLPDGEQIMLDAPKWLLAWSIADVALALLLCVVGGGLIALSKWARPLGMLVAAVQVVSGIGSVVALIVSTQQLPTADGPRGQTVIAGSIGAIVFQLLGIVFPVILLAILARRSTADALDPAKRQPAFT